MSRASAGLAGRPHRRLASRDRKPPCVLRWSGCSFPSSVIWCSRRRSSPGGADVRPFTSTISIDEARRRLAANVQPIERTERVPLRQAFWPRRRRRRVVDDRRAAVRPLRDGRLRRASPPTPQAPIASRRRAFASSIASIRAQASGRHGCAGHLRGDRDRRAAAGWRRRRRDGRGDGATCRRGQLGRDFRGSPGGPAHRTARRRHRRRAISWSAAGDVLNPSRVGALAAHRVRQTSRYSRGRASRFSRPATKSSTRACRLPPARSTTSIASRSPRSPPRTAACRMPHPPVHDSLDALDAALDACAAADVIVFSGGSSVGERDLIVDLVAARGEMIFHGIAVQAGKPTAFARIDGDAVLRHARQSDLVPVERVHPARAVSSRHGPSAASTHHERFARRSAGASCRRPDGTSSTRCAPGTAWPFRLSRAPATSPACRRPTATSKSLQTRASSRRGRPWT